MDYSVADAIAAAGGDAATGRSGDISAILPFGIAPGAKVVMRREKMAAEQVRVYMVDTLIPFMHVDTETLRCQIDTDRSG